MKHQRIARELRASRVDRETLAAREYHSAKGFGAVVMADSLAHWQTFGMTALTRLQAESPELYVAFMAKVLSESVKVGQAQVTQPVNNRLIIEWADPDKKSLSTADPARLDNMLDDAIMVTAGDDAEDFAVEQDVERTGLMIGHER
jgi:hypothetical protein